MRNQEQHGTVLEAEKAKVKPPPLYKVMLLNDDYTPMDFVVVVLQTVFAMSREKATQVMLQVHREGMGVCGTYTREVAIGEGRTGDQHRTQAPASASVHDGGDVSVIVAGREGSRGVGKGEGRSMIAQELEVSLHMAFVEARQKQHEFITVEHLLLAMLDNPSAAEVLKACGVDLDELRGVLSDFIQEHTPRLAPHSDADTQPTQGFQRVIQRAILHVQSSGKKEVTGANVLVAIFGEKESHAVYFLNQRGVTRLDVVNYIAHGITKTPQQKQDKQESEGRRRQRQRGAGRARCVHAEPERTRQGRQDRSSDRARARARARDPDAVPPAQEQSAAGRRSRRGQDRDRRRPGAPHQRRRRCPNCCATTRSIRSTWARCWPAPSIAATSSSG